MCTKLHHIKIEFFYSKAKNTVEYSQIDRKTYAEIALSSLTIGKVLKHIKFLYVFQFWQIFVWLTYNLLMILMIACDILFNFFQER